MKKFLLVFYFDSSIGLNGQNVLLCSHRLCGLGIWCPTPLRRVCGYWGKASCLFLIASLVMRGTSTASAPRYSYIVVLVFAIYAPLIH